MPVRADVSIRASEPPSRTLLLPGALRAVVQPVVRLADGEVIGYEALTRAVDAVEPGAPDAWFARAAIEGWSAELEAACLRAIVELGAPPEDRLLFVNVLPRHLVAPEVLALRELLPTRVVLELTEQEAIADVEAVRHALGRWTSAGARLALDDVGSGYAGLQQVVHLQPEFLKLDRSLITGIDSDRVRQALVASLVGFAGQVGTTIIAEGVETHSELKWLRDAGVPLAQGFHLARPGEPWPEPVARGRGRTRPRRPHRGDRAGDPDRVGGRGVRGRGRRAVRHRGRDALGLPRERGAAPVPGPTGALAGARRDAGWCRGHRSDVPQR